MSLAIQTATLVLLATGCFFVLLGSVSLVKLSSFFHRVHGPTKASTMGVGCILLASVLHHWTIGNGLHPREVLITVFLFLTAPVSAHLMSLAALSLMDARPRDPSATIEGEGRIREDGDEPRDAASSEGRETGTESAPATAPQQPFDAR